MAIPEMQKDEIEILISGIANNGQIYSSWQVGTVLRKILSNKNITEGECLNIGLVQEPGWFSHKSLKNHDF
jgi:hypothetical protein